MTHSFRFQPEAPLVAGRADPRCRAIVILPVRDEEASITATLDALAVQTDVYGHTLPPETFEILVLLNNCVDQSAAVAQLWKRAHPGIRLHLVERTLPAHLAHAGTARRLLMDTAWHRLYPVDSPAATILSTDSDTLPATDWISRNLMAIHGGADAVGGVIRLKPGHLEQLPAGARHAYLRDRRYQQLVAELEHLLDPRPGDPWPRHLEHFGASLACTRDAYAAAGGMPVVSTLEDVAFVDALQSVGALLRHDPSVVVYTSSRLDGRARVGLSGQLRSWQAMSDGGQQHQVPSVAWLSHSFKLLRRLRYLYADKTLPAANQLIPVQHWKTIRNALRSAGSEASFLAHVGASQLIVATFVGDRDAEIEETNRGLVEAIKHLRAGFASQPAAAGGPLTTPDRFVAAHPGGNLHAVPAGAASTPAVRAILRAPDPPSLGSPSPAE